MLNTLYLSPAVSNRVSIVINSEVGTVLSLVGNEGCYGTVRRSGTGTAGQRSATLLLKRGSEWKSF
eukprot:scaffold5387_cov251-Ochromonas_danica.AAC.9